MDCVQTGRIDVLGTIKKRRSKHHTSPSQPTERQQADVMACPLILKLTATYLTEEADRYKDGRLLDKIIPKMSGLNKEFNDIPQIKDYVSYRREEFAEYAEAGAREWQRYNAEYESQAAYTAEDIPKCTQRPLLSWAVGSIVTFLGR